MTELGKPSVDEEAKLSKAKLIKRSECWSESKLRDDKRGHLPWRKLRLAQSRIE